MAGEPLPTARRNFDLTGDLPARPRIPRDLTWGIAIIAVYLIHVAQVLATACPFWAMCCIVCVPILPFAWPLAALINFIAILRRTFDGGVSRSIRIGVMILLTVCVADQLTGGDYRWFEMSMRHQATKLHLDNLQAWAQSQLSSPQQQSVWEEKGLATNQLPIQCQNLPYHYYPLYRPDSAGGPFIQLGTGGWDMGWGYIIGRTDLSAPSPVATGSPGSHWVKKLKPGIFIFASDV